MPRYCFTWTVTGSTIIESPTLGEAQIAFDEMSLAEAQDDGDSDFVQDEVLIESEPGCFDKTAEV